MNKITALEGKYEPDERVEIHEYTVKQLTQRIVTHDAGIAELVKNSCDALSESDAPAESRIIIILLKNEQANMPALLGCLDFVGMTTDKIESRFKNWGDPDAALGGYAGRRKGGHGHGGKAYMVNMFKEYALLITCAGGYGNRYGFSKGNILPGYFPDRAQGRRFPVQSKEKLLEDNLHPFAIKLTDLPPEAREVLSKGMGFTLVKGVDPKDLTNGRFNVTALLSELQGHPQMIEVLQEAKIYIMLDGRPERNAWPLELEPIEPMDEAKEPREFLIPEKIIHPTTNEEMLTIEAPSGSKGKLILRTSKKSMMWFKKQRHRIYIHAGNEYIGSWDIRDLVGKGFGDQVYGDLFLDTLLQYKTSDRVEPAPSSLTVAVKEWLRQTIDKYCLEFVKLEKLKATQRDRIEWQRISETMNQWKNKFLKNLGIGVGGQPGTGGTTTPHPPSPRGKVANTYITLSHELAGIGVAIQPSIEFRDVAGQRVRTVPYRWNSSDWNVATVDEDLFRVLTHSPGKTEIWAETLEGNITSNRVCLTVLDIKNITMKEEIVEIPAGGFKPLGTSVEDREKNKYEGVYLNWISGNNEVVRVGPAGVVWAVATGCTEVTAGDDRVLASPGTTVKVVEGVGTGKQKGRGYPQILLSGIDLDPFEPDNQPEQFLTRQHPPISQRVYPDDVEAQIWWINMAAPLANRYWLEASGLVPTSDKTRQWRVYYLERLIEAMVKIRLNLDYKFEGQTNWDMLKERWDDVMIEMQEAMASELESFLESQELPRVE